jgi:radical SAM protein with 4Fe4S-binding SPASM domain
VNLVGEAGKLPVRSSETVPEQIGANRAPVDRAPALRAVRNLLLRSPTVVRIVKDVYRWPPLANSRPFRWAVGRRIAAADAGLEHIAPRITIETVLTCNARCTMCVHSEKRMVGLMSMELFRRLVAECAEWGIEELGLSVYGEPLIDKHWLERLRLVRAAGMRYSFFSNASMLTEDKAQAMLELGGWSEVNFSVNGFSTAVYEAVMPPLSRERVYENIERFLALRSRYGGGPKVTVSCVALRENVHELDAYRRYWGPRVDRVSIADRTDWLGELKKTEGAGTAGRRLRVFSDEVRPQPCPSLWSTMYVYHDGRVAPCCEDSGLRALIVGDTTEQSLREIFLGERMTALRAEHREDRRGENAICGRCRVNWPWV